MRTFLVATLLGIGILATAADSHAQSISIGRHGVVISGPGSYVPYQSYYASPYYQYSTPYYSQYGYSSDSYWNGGWSGNWNRAPHYHPPVYHRGYWHDGHYHPGHWHSGYWHRGRR